MVRMFDSRHAVGKDNILFWRVKRIFKKTVPNGFDLCPSVLVVRFILIKHDLRFL